MLAARSMGLLIKLISIHLESLVLVSGTVFIWMVLSGCQSLGSSVGLKGAVDGPEYFTGERVLYQQGQTFPDFSDVSEDQWQEMADSPAPSVNRIYAILVTRGSSQALTEARKFLLSHPGDLDTLEALARILYLEKQMDLAYHYADYVVKKDNQRGEMYNIMGLVSLFRAQSPGEFREAERWFDRAHSVAPNAVVSLINLGFMYLEMGALQRAESTFLRALENCRNCSPAMLGMGITSRRLGADKKAIQFFRLALKKDLPDRTRYKFHYHLALILRNNPKTAPQAEELLVEVVQNLPRKEGLHSRSRALLSEIRTGLNEGPRL